MSDYLSDEEQIERLKSWWNENGLFLIGSILAAVLGIVSWNFYSSYQDDIGVSSTEFLRNYLESDSERREAIVVKLSQDYSGSTAHVLVLFDQAKKKIANGELFEAERLFEDALKISEEAMLRDLALIRLAKIQNELEKTENALAALAKVKTKGFLSWALELKGDIHSNRKEVELAHQSYERALDELGEGVLRPLLKIKLDNSSPFQGIYVKPDIQLNQALKEAEESLKLKMRVDESD